MKSLEDIALRNTPAIDADATLGLAAGTLEAADFAEIRPRACALESIGKTGLEEAVNFLSKITRSDLGPDPNQSLWPAAQVALRDAQLRRIADSQAKIEFLEGLVTASKDGRSSIAFWAVDELCNRGAQMSLPVIYKSVRSRRDVQRDEDEIRFCEDRIRVVMSNSDRVKALGSVLTISNSVRDHQLVGWAVNQLIEMQEDAAYSELDRFLTEIDRVPENSPMREDLFGFKHNILKYQRKIGRTK